MLYLVTPNQPLRWSDLPATLALDVATEHNADLANLDWLPSERPTSHYLVRLALRHGHTCSTGIVLDAADISVLGRGDELRQLDLERTEAEQNLRSNNEQMEQLMPGWTTAGETLGEQVTQAMAEGAAEADQDEAEMLAAPLRPELVAHWERLGGFDPDAQ